MAVPAVGTGVVPAATKCAESEVNNVVDDRELTPSFLDYQFSGLPVFQKFFLAEKRRPEGPP